MPYEVRSKLSRNDGDASNVPFSETLPRRSLACQPSRFGNARTLSNGH
jgi:hypothetical protein